MTYISRKLLPNEQNYSTVKKEALAIKWAVDKLRYYLLGREFTLVTDHAPLKWMATAKDTNARVTRWFLALQDYRFKVDHRPGREHANANALSRRDACLWAIRGAPGLHQRVEECGNLARTQRPGKPRGQVIQGVYLPFPLEGAWDRRIATAINAMGNSCAGEGDKRDADGLSGRKHVVTGRRHREPWTGRPSTRPRRTLWERDGVTGDPMANRDRGHTVRRIRGTPEAHGAQAF